MGNFYKPEAVLYYVKAEAVLYYVKPEAALEIVRGNLVICPNIFIIFIRAICMHRHVILPMYTCPSKILQN